MAEKRGTYHVNEVRRASRCHFSLSMCLSHCQWLVLHVANSIKVKHTSTGNVLNNNLNQICSSMTHYTGRRNLRDRDTLAVESASE